MKYRQRQRTGTSVPLYHELSLSVTEICRPAYEKFAITYVDYARIYPDRKIAVLTSAPQYVDFFIHHRTYATEPSYILNPGFHLWQSYISQPFLQEAMTDYGFSHGLTLLQPCESYIEIFNIATFQENHHILSLYLNQQTLIKQFLHYFKIQAKSLIATVEKAPFMLKHDHRLSVNTSEHYQDTQSFHQQILIQTSPTIIYDNQVIILTRREAQSLYLLRQGKSAKYIARVLNLSYRTVEIYFANILKKTRARSRLELLACLEKDSVQLLEQYL